MSHDKAYSKKKYERALNRAKNGQILIRGSFDDEMANMVIDCIETAEAEGLNEVTLLIDSNGGRHINFNSIAAAMNISGMKFTGIVMSKAYSNGFRILQHCHHRIALRSAYLMMHWGYYRLDNNELAALIRGENRPVEHVVQIFNNVLNEVHQRTGVPDEELIKMATEEHMILASQALEIGFIDEILEDLPTRFQKENTTDSE